MSNLFFVIQVDLPFYNHSCAIFIFNSSVLIFSWQTYFSEQSFATYVFLFMISLLFSDFYIEHSEFLLNFNVWSGIFCDIPVSLCSAFDIPLYGHFCSIVQTYFKFFFSYILMVNDVLHTFWAEDLHFILLFTILLLYAISYVLPSECILCLIFAGFQ